MRRKKVGIVYNKPVTQEHPHWEASQDVVTQVEAIERTLEDLGHSTVRTPFTRDLSGFAETMNREKADLVFNLCESVDEDPRLVWHPAAVLELLEIPFSGSPSVALMLTTDKLLTKRMLKATGIRTPDYLVYDASKTFSPSVLRFPLIVKPRFEDASIGIDQDSIFEDEPGLRRGLQEFFSRYGTLLVEEYIAGREFNVSLFGYPGVAVLPLAEIDFSAFPENLYPIVGYRAKWERGSFEYGHTPRMFPRELPQLVFSKINGTALECFRLFGLRDYGRVDLRVDDHGRIYVLEVNANPCLSPDAGFAASAQEGDLDYAALVAGIADFTSQRAVSQDQKKPLFSDK